MAEGKVCNVAMRKRHLEASRAYRESSTVNMASRVNWGVRQACGGGVREEAMKGAESGPRKRIAEMVGLHQNQKLGEGKLVKSWRSLALGAGSGREEPGCRHRLCNRYLPC